MYFKVDLDLLLIEHIDIINQQLRITFGNDFIPQELPEAGLGCHPYHITLVGKIHHIFDELESANDYICQFQSKCSDIVVKPSDQVRITNRGTVMWIIHSDTLKNLGKNIYKHLRNRKLSDYTTSDYLHITLGICKNINSHGKTIHMHPDLFNILNNEYKITSLGSDY